VSIPADSLSVSPIHTDYEPFFKSTLGTIADLAVASLSQHPSVRPEISSGRSSEEFTPCSNFYPNILYHIPKPTVVHLALASFTIVRAGILEYLSLHLPVTLLRRFICNLTSVYGYFYDMVKRKYTYIYLSTLPGCGLQNRIQRPSRWPNLNAK